MLALASPASLKGVLSPQDAALAARDGHAQSPRRRRGRSAGRGRWRGDGGRDPAGARRHLARGGRQRRARTADRRRAGCCWTTARRSSSRPRRSACRCYAGTNATRCARRAAGSVSCSSQRSLGEPAALFVCLGGTATVDGGASMREVVGRRLDGIPMRVLCDVRNPLLGKRGAARVFGPQKGARPEAVELLEARLGGTRGARALPRPSGRGSGRRARRGARGTRRRARGRSRARARHDRFRRTCAQRRPRRHGRGHGRRDDPGREGARGRRPPLRAAGRPLRGLRRASSGAGCAPMRCRAAGRGPATTSSGWARS